MSRFVNDEDVRAVVRRLEACTLELPEFHHANHLAVGLAYLQAADFEGAMQLMRASLQRFSAHHGKMGYHETITRFWLWKLQQLTEANPGLGLAKLCDLAALQLGNKELIFRYYDRERLMGPEARERWIPPHREAPGECEILVRSPPAGM
jgi:hypothetical protein